MAATLIAGAPPKHPRAYRQWLDAEAGQWKGARDKQGKKVAIPKGARTRWRAQASVRLWTGEVVKRDATGQTAAAAEDGVVAVLKALLDESNPTRPRSDLSVADVARLWLDAPERHDVATSSLGVYDSNLRCWLLPSVLPAIAKLRIRQVEPRDVSKWLLSVAAASGIPTAKTARSVLSAVFRYGIAEGHATTNPVRDATTPSQRVIDAERTRQGVTARTKRPGPSAALDHGRAFTAGEVARVLAAASSTQERCDDDLTDVLAFLDGTGVRLGAALATLWTDVDLDGDGWTAGTDLDPRYAWFETGEFTIARVKGKGLVRAAYGETKAGVRRLALPAELADRLRKRRTVAQSEWVFPNPLDRTQPREVSFVGKRLRGILDTTPGDDGQPMTWASSHSFRRTLVTDAHDAGTPDRHIAGQGGWSRIQVLQDHYIARVPVSTLGADLRNATPRVTPTVTPSADGESDSESDPGGSQV